MQLKNYLEPIAGFNMTYSITYITKTGAEMIAEVEAKDIAQAFLRFDFENNYLWVRTIKPSISHV